MLKSLTQIGFKKISNGFIAVITIALINVIVSFYFISSNKKIIKRLTEVINPYVESLESFNLLVTESKMYTTNWVYLRNSVEDKEHLKELHEARFPLLKKNLIGFFGSLEKMQDKDSLISTFAKFEALLDIEKGVMTLLVDFDDYENPNKMFQGEDIIESEVLPRTEEIMGSLKTIIQKNQEEAMIMKNNMLVSFNGLLTLIFAVSLTLLIAVVLAALFISSSIRFPVMKMRDIIMSLGRGEMPKEQMKTTKDVIGEMAVSVNKLSDSFTKTSEFADEIGKGNLTANFNPLSENDTLGIALINMRDSLKAYSDHMEQKVAERTKEVMEKNVKLEHAYKEIRDSITYAKRIQGAILPKTHVLQKSFENAFVLYKPKDIVCGDFYWFNKVGDELVVVAADCTGHGVPGALMTVIGNSLLNQIVNASTTSPAQILNQIDRKLIETLRQHTELNSNGGIEISINDGMDLAICRCRMSKNEIVFSAAKRPLYIFKKGEWIEIKGNKFPIGGSQHYGEKIFTEHKLMMQPGDTIYMFSDGYQDQFGGPDQKKFMVKQFRELLTKIQPLSMDEQCKTLDNAIVNWQGNNEQTDDVLVIGLRF